MIKLSQTTFVQSPAFLNCVPCVQEHFEAWGYCQNPTLTQPNSTQINSMQLELRLAILANITQAEPTPLP